MNLNNIPSNTKWLDALKKTWSIITTVGSSLWHFLFTEIRWLLFGFWDGLIGQVLLYVFCLIVGGMLGSWLIAKALYPILPAAVAESIKATQQKDFAMSHEFFTSTPELFLSGWVFGVGSAIVIILWGIRNGLAYIFRPKDLLEKVASTKKEIKAVQEELRQMKNGPR